MMCKKYHSRLCAVRVTMNGSGREGRNENSQGFNHPILCIVSCLDALVHFHSLLMHCVIIESIVL